MSPGRNDSCPCGSGKKHKQCCLTRREEEAVVEAGWLRMRRAEGELVSRLTKHMAQHYGPGAVEEAWDEFTLWPEPPAEMGGWPEADTSFPRWVLFDWEPEPGQLPDGAERPAITVARHYVERRGTRLDSYERNYIEEVSSQPYTFYMVKATVPGREVALRDIMRRRDVTVRERQASATLRPGQIVFTKVVSLGGEAVMLGCAPYALPNRHFDDVVALRERIAKHHELNAATLREFDFELRELYLDLREAVLNAAPPEVQNTDGEPLQLTRLDFDLDCSPQDAFTALLPLTLEDDPAWFEDVIERDQAGDMTAAQMSWLRPGKRRNRDWPNTVLGEIEIRGRRLTVNVNSQARADAIRQEIAARLGPRAWQKNVVIQSVQEMLAAAAAEGSSGPPSGWDRVDGEPPSPEVEALMAQMGAEHWRNWPDVPLPALRGRTPRQAAATPDGRERLEALFLDFAAREHIPGSVAPDVAALRRELGM